jgi:hypothetical protein
MIASGTGHSSLSANARGEDLFTQSDFEGSEIEGHGMLQRRHGQGVAGSRRGHPTAGVVLLSVTLVVRLRG